MSEPNLGTEQQLERLVRLTAVSLVDGKTQEEQIRLLSTVGFAPTEIAELIGTTPNNVRVRLTAIRKRSKKKAVGKKKAAK